jgi:hypothetical protein
MPLRRMLHCIAYNCNNKEKALKRGVPFYRLPSAYKPLLQQWLSKLRLKDPPVSPNSRLCTDHFQPDCFERFSELKEIQVICLKLDAVPVCHLSGSDQMDQLAKEDGRFKLVYLNSLATSRNQYTIVYLILIMIAVYITQAVAYFKSQVS